MLLGQLQQLCNDAGAALGEIDLFRRIVIEVEQLPFVRAARGKLRVDLE